VNLEIVSQWIYNNQYYSSAFIFFWGGGGGRGKGLGAYSRRALIRGWALIRINTVGCLPFTWAKFLTGKVSPGIAFTICTKKTTAKAWNCRYQRVLWKTGTRISVWNIPPGKIGLPFQMFRCSRKISAGTTQKVVFHLLSNWVFGKLFVMVNNLWPIKSTYVIPRNKSHAYYVTIEPRANGRDIVGQHKTPIWCYMLRPFAHPVACQFSVVGNCWAKFEAGQARQPRRYGVCQYGNTL